MELGAEGDHGRRKVPRQRRVPRDDRHQAQGVSDWGKEETRRRTGNKGCEVSGASAAVGGVVRGGGEEEGADLSEVLSAELQPEVHFSHGRREAGGGGVTRARKVKMAPARLLKMMEQRRHWEGLQTLQELKLPKRMRDGGVWGGSGRGGEAEV